MQEMRKEINSLQKDGIKYNEQLFLTLTFDELGNTSGYFLAIIKRQCSEWVKKPWDFNTSSFIANMINFYTNYKFTGKWDKQGAYHNKVLVSLATSMKHEPTKNKKSPSTLLAMWPIILPQSLETLTVRLHVNLIISGGPLHYLIPGPSTSGSIFTSGKTKKWYKTACICLTPTTTNSGLSAGPNTMLIGKRSSSLRKSVNLKPVLPILLRNHLSETFP